jgi:aminoglycoside phosphotransferase (APT) family kinase protein
VHGDYRLDNTMMDSDDPGTIVAVLDWEMSTLGDPLADLGLFLLYWGQADAQVIATGVAIDQNEGFLSRDEVTRRYAELSGRSVDDLDWYVIFASYKLAIIVEGINARFQMGKTLGDGFEAMGAMVTGLIDGALEQADRSDIAALRG